MVRLLAEGRAERHHGRAGGKVLHDGVGPKGSGEREESLGYRRIHQFDEEGRLVAVQMAADLEIDCFLSLNFLPRSLQVSPSAVLSTLRAADQHGVGADRIILEVSEGEAIDDTRGFVSRVKDLGCRIAIDDFGAGYSGLNLLADFQPDLIKIDMNLVRDIVNCGPRQAIVRAIIQACKELDIDVVAEGVETTDEFHWFEDQGVRLFQGFLFAKAQFESLPAARFPEVRVFQA